jgi:hypothetical protein
MQVRGRDGLDGQRQLQQVSHELLPDPERDVLRREGLVRLDGCDQVSQRLGLPAERSGLSARPRPAALAGGERQGDEARRRERTTGLRAPPRR